MFKWATVVGVLVKKIRMMVKVMRMMILSLDDDDGEQPCWPRIRGFGSVPWSPPKKIIIHFVWMEARFHRPIYNVTV